MEGVQREALGGSCRNFIGFFFMVFYRFIIFRSRVTCATEDDYRG
jgi:hypothetical protein